MSHCKAPIFKTCERCHGNQSTICYTSTTYHNKILDKLDDGERLWLLWVIAKAEGLDKYFSGSVSDFGKSVRKIYGNTVDFPCNNM